MLPLIVVLPLSLFIWFCCVAILASAIGVCAVYRFIGSFGRGFEHICGGVFGALIWGGFAIIIGTGALQCGAYVIDGLIARLT